MAPVTVTGALHTRIKEINMTKRQTNRRRAARATVDLILSNGGGLLYLLLATRSAPYSQAREAHHTLAQVIEARVRAYVLASFAALAPDTAPVASVITAMVSKATARVVAALPKCASRSPGDFSRWLDRQIADAVEDDGDGDPHGGPAVRLPATDIASAWALHTLPIPRAERDALVEAVLAELTPRERQILQAMANPEASWVTVAQSLRLSLFAAKRLYAHANARAHQIAVRLAARAAGDTGPADGEAAVA